MSHFVYIVFRLCFLSDFIDVAAFSACNACNHAVFKKKSIFNCKSLIHIQIILKVCILNKFVHLFVI